MSLHLRKRVVKMEPFRMCTCSRLYVLCRFFCVNFLNKDNTVGILNSLFPEMEKKTSEKKSWQSQ